MNERIRELAEQADDYERKLGKGIGPTRDEKFAELIVQESVQFLKDCNSEFEAEQLEEFWDL
jgi:hypothetical protein